MISILNESISIFSLANDPNGDILAGSSRGRIFKTADEGETWIRVDNNFSGYKGEFFDVRSLVINSKGHYFACISCGVFHSIDKGSGESPALLVQVNANRSAVLGIGDPVILFVRGNEIGQDRRRVQ